MFTIPIDFALNRISPQIRFITLMILIIILGTEELARKCLFPTPPDGSAPILDRILPAAGWERRELRVARYEEAPRVIATMIAELAKQVDEF